MTQRIENKRILTKEIKNIKLKKYDL